MKSYIHPLIVHFYHHMIVRVLTSEFRSGFGYFRFVYESNFFAEVEVTGISVIDSVKLQKCCVVIGVASSSVS